MNKRLSLSFVAAALIVLSGAARAQCENMVVVVRNSIYQINGLDAFCQEFNKIKTDLASLKSALSAARQENALLKGRLNMAVVAPHDDSVARGDGLARNANDATSIR